MAKKTTKPKEEQKKDFDQNLEDAENLANRMGMNKADFLIIMDRGKYKIGYKTTESQLRKDYNKYILGK